MEDEIGSVKQPRLERHIFQAVCIEWECHNSLPSLDDHELLPNLVWRGHMILKGHARSEPTQRATSFGRRNFPRSAKERERGGPRPKRVRNSNYFATFCPGRVRERAVLWHVPYPPSPPISPSSHHLFQWDKLPQRMSACLNSAEREGERAWVRHGGAAWCPRRRSLV